MDGFRRAERRTIKTRDRGYEPTVRPAMPTGPGDRYYDMRVANTKTATSALARELKGRHLQMIAFGGAIAVADGPMGTGLFVVSGSSLYKGGPASVLCSYLFIGALQYCTMQSLCELCIIFPIAGSFSAFSTRFLDPSWGFAMGWNYCFQWLLALPLELIAAAYTITYWNEHLNKAIFITIFLLAILAINLVGIKAYGEAEFIFSIIKITAVIGFILLAIVINIGGRPESGYIGSQYWRNPGPFNNGLKGFSSCLVTSAFSFAGTELIGLAAAETANPRKSFPAAIKQVFWRIAIFYIVAILLVGLLIPSNEPRLINGKNNADASASPFVIAIESAGTTILSSVMNAVILIAVISVGNSAVFGSSRTLAALAEQSHAPQIFAYVDKQGRPLMAILFAALVGMMAYLAELKVYDNILHWLISISTLSTVFTWASISLCHIRFRKAWAYASYPLEKLPFRSSVGVIGSWFAFVGYVLVLLSQIWLAISPIETPGLDTSPSGRVKIFFLRAMTIPIVLICYISHKIWLRTRVIRAHEMDVDTGRRHYRVHIINEQERDERRGWPLWKKIYRTLC
ncbi:amino acid permease/ SLC12A domain-containing protein [Dactylonectria macrodidyma]|uniref:Amino acid permease/ SLC12A domain-containing protein n=1 Tax=Dactylonectria macrodidyma TaxID=307937 RepID=A0A9P9E5A7_9HYPO|nr:amino acid permease/ SLC12A domain-containing protein [Dactylonectria macrodidyma]